ncbi:MAG: serine hydrolase [Eubacteriales bacterium]
MRKFISVFMAGFLALSITGCARETPNGITGKPSDSSDAAQTVDNDPAAPAAWPDNAWSVSSPEKQGVNPEILAEADKQIKDNYPNVYSLLVVRHGYLIYEKYYQGMSENDANPVYSVTKSVMSALTGIAKRDGIIDNIDQKLSEIFPEYFIENNDTKKKDITIKDVLTMTGGLESIDNDYYSYFMSPDLLDYVLKKPITDTPGEKFVYNTGLTHFLSAIISNASGTSTKEYADENLFSKIGISVNYWETDNAGINIGGFGINMMPRDMAKFGFLYLHNALWDGTQVIPEEWIKESTQKQIAANAATDYGYLFWLQTVRDTAKDREYFTYRASGMGGQYIMVIPDLDMVAVVTANSDVSSKDGSDTLRIITDYVIPAVE